MQKRNVDLDELLEQKQKIYVRSNTVKSNILLVVQMEDKAGRKHPLRIPPSRFPVSVSSQFSNDVIRESSDLRTMLSKGVLILMDPKEAEAILKTPEAKEELKTFSMSVFADSAPTNVVRDNMERLKKASTPVTDAADVLGGGTDDNEEMASPRVQALVASLTNKEKTSKETLTQLKRLKGNLSEADLTYVIKACSAESQIREFAESSLAELSARPEGPFDDSEE